MTFMKPFFTKPTLARQLSVKNFYAELQENPTNGVVTGHTKQDGQADGSDLHI